MPSISADSPIRHHPLTTKTRRYFVDLQRRLERHVKRRPGAPPVPGDWIPYDEQGRYSCSGEDGLALTVSFATLGRALGILDALIKGLSKHGFRIESAEAGDGRFTRKPLTWLLAMGAGERFGFRMREGYTRRERSAKELAVLRKDHVYVSSYAYEPNGSLTLELYGQEYGFKETFRDTEQATLESELDRIIKVFVDAVPRQQRLRAARERAAQIGQEAKRRRWCELERSRREEVALEGLLVEAGRAHDFRQLRRYLDRLEGAALKQGAVSDEFRNWLSHARALVDAHDPVLKRMDRSPVDDEERGDRRL
jgi:hypothetical protein